MSSAVNICSPGFGASCALCCGSHNYIAGPDDLDSIFSERSVVVKNFNRDYIVKHMTSSRSSMTGSYYYPETRPFIITLPAREEASRKCPFVGYADDSHEAGCLLYPHKKVYGNMIDCYQNYRNKVFSCDSGKNLSDEEILFAASLTGDWYYYSILIHSIEYLRILINKYPEQNAVNDEDLNQIKYDLQKLFESNPEYIRMETYFS